jgi:hypothetical protein
MHNVSETPEPHPGLDLGVMQAMLDIGLALEREARIGHDRRDRREDGFLAAHADCYRSLAEAIIDLVNAHPVLGPEQLAPMLENIERAAWRRQDRLPDRALNRRKVEEWRRRRREDPTETEKIIDLLRGGA